MFVLWERVHIFIILLTPSRHLVEDGMHLLKNGTSAQFRGTLGRLIFTFTRLLLCHISNGDAALLDESDDCSCYSFCRVGFNIS